MAHKSRDALEAGRALCDRWARDLDLRISGSRDRNVIRAQLLADRRGPPGPRHAMAHMDLIDCVTVLVHYADQGKVGPLKIKAVQEITGKRLVHRDYWRAMERTSLVMMGYELASPLGVPMRDMDKAAQGETVELEAEALDEMEQLRQDRMRRRMKGP